MNDHDDCRDEVFCDRGYEVLGSVVQGTQMAQPDPFDVDGPHAEARRAFLTTLDQVRAGPTSRILLIRGEAGCGKTHLIRSLRAQVHGGGHGVIAYVHMTSEHGDYRQYLLRQVVRSLSDPYDAQAADGASASALERISDALIQSGGLEDGAAEKLRDADDAALAALVSDYADQLSEQPRFAPVALNTLRIFLYRQSLRKPIQRRVGSFLNGEPMGEMDWQKLGAMPRECDRLPMHLLAELAKITRAALGTPLVICVDQIEASDVTGKNHDPFINAMGTACELMENVPGLMILLSCLDSAYDAHAPHLMGSYRHRIENDPAPLNLVSARTADELRRIVSRRLKWLYEDVGLEHVPADTVYPMPDDLPERLRQQPVRRVLQQVYGYWHDCHAAARIVPWRLDPAPLAAAPEADDPDVDRLRIAWDEFRTRGDHAVSEDDDQQIDLLAWALGESAGEMEDGAAAHVERVVAEDGQPAIYALALTVTEPRTDPRVRRVGLCDKDARGNGLLKQMKALDAGRRAGETMVVVRSTRFPKSGVAFGHVKAWQKAGDRFVVIEDAAWRTLAAMRAFLAAEAGRFPAGVVREWRKTDAPLINLPEIAAIVHGARPAAVPPAVAPTPDPARNTDRPRPPDDAAPPPPAGPIEIGQTDGFTQSPVTLDPQVLTRHTAIFGAHGSGKTVLALSIAEMLLERGVGVIAFDRKGELATYAADGAWDAMTGAPDERRRRAALRARVDVHLYTPGNPAGRPLVLPVLPRGLGAPPSEQGEAEARQAAMILCDVCAPPKAKEALFATVLCRAVELLCAADEPRTLDDLQDLLLTAPQELLAMLPLYTERHCEEVGRRLSERRVAHGPLFSDVGERLDLPRMLATDDGRARLNVINTQFLDGDSALIWSAQFLAAAGRFVADHPAPPGGRLRALLIFDEADQYLPAIRKPAAKAGMENLLKRARPAGVGVLLVSQNAGDFDFRAMDNISTVFTGKLAAGRPLDELRPRLGDATDHLARKSRGKFVMGVDADVREITANMCLVRPDQLPRDEVQRLAAAQAAR